MVKHLRDWPVILEKPVEFKAAVISNAAAAAAAAAAPPLRCWLPIHEVASDRMSLPLANGWCLAASAQQMDTLLAESASDPPPTLLLDLSLKADLNSYYHYYAKERGPSSVPVTSAQSDPPCAICILDW